MKHMACRLNSHFQLPYPLMIIRGVTLNPSDIVDTGCLAVKVENADQMEVKIKYFSESNGQLDRKT